MTEVHQSNPTNPEIAANVPYFEWAAVNWAEALRGGSDELPTGEVIQAKADELNVSFEYLQAVLREVSRVHSTV